MLHIGGMAGDRDAAIERFERGVELLSDAARARLVVENDDRTFSLQDALEVHRRTGLRVVWDILHHHCLDPAGIPDREALEAALETWPAGGGRPKIHYSTPKTAMEERKRKVGRRVERSWVLPQLRAHADMIDPIAFEHFVTRDGGRAGLRRDARGQGEGPRPAAPARAARGPRRGAQAGSSSAFAADRVEVERLVADLVEQDDHLVVLVALDGRLAPLRVPDAAADGEGHVGVAAASPARPASHRSQCPHGPASPRRSTTAGTRAGRRRTARRTRASSPAASGRRSRGRPATRAAASTASSPRSPVAATEPSGRTSTAPTSSSRPSAVSSLDSDRSVASLSSDASTGSAAGRRASPPSRAGRGRPGRAGEELAQPEVLGAVQQQGAAPARRHGRRGRPPASRRRSTRPRRGARRSARWACRCPCRTRSWRRSRRTRRR